MIENKYEALKLKLKLNLIFSLNFLPKQLKIRNKNI